MNGCSGEGDIGSPGEMIGAFPPNPIAGGPTNLGSLPLPSRILGSVGSTVVVVKTIVPGTTVPVGNGNALWLPGEETTGSVCIGAVTTVAVP